MSTTSVSSSRSGAPNSGSGQKRAPRLPRDRSFRGRQFLRRLLTLLSIATLTGLVVLGAGVAYAWSTLPLPPDKPLAQTTFVTDAAGNELATFNAGENRVPVALGDVPPVLVQAVIATEDRKFYSHHGVDPRALVRAGVADVRKEGGLQGGSTLTQQYVKTTYVGQERTLRRKFREAVLAVKLEQRLSKDEILERYLNTIYLGRGVYGVQTASQAYFAKDVKALGLRESAYIAGLIRAPELADVSTAPETATARRDRTLVSMIDHGVITAEQQAEVVAQPLNSYVIPRNRGITQAKSAQGAGSSQFFVDWVRRLLVHRYGEETVEAGGLRIKTTLDPALQAKAYESVYGFLRPGEPAGALVSLGEDGSVKAMIGGRDYRQSQVNLAVGREGGGTGRQAGSTFKPFALAATIEGGTCYRERYAGPARQVFDDNGRPWTVSNFGDEAFGRVDLIDATASSVNTVYAQLAQDLGGLRISTMAQKLGIESPLRGNKAAVLGTDDVSPLEMAAAYLTFAEGGMRVTPNPILEVRRADGRVLERLKAERRRVIDEETAKTVNLALQQVVQRGSGRAANIGGAVAGKTGTTEENGDAWFVGYTPTLSTAVWMGYPEGAARKMSNVRGIAVTGGTFPARIWADYMRTASAATIARGDETFPAPTECRTDEDAATTTTSTTSAVSPATSSVRRSTTVPSTSTPPTTTGRLQDLSRPLGRREPERKRSPQVTSTPTTEPEVIGRPGPPVKG